MTLRRECWLAMMTTLMTSWRWNFPLTFHCNVMMADGLCNNVDMNMTAQQQHNWRWWTMSAAAGLLSLFCFGIYCNIDDLQMDSHVSYWLWCSVMMVLVHFVGLLTALRYQDCSECNSDILLGLLCLFWRQENPKQAFMRKDMMTHWCLLNCRNW